MLLTGGDSEVIAKQELPPPRPHPPPSCPPLPLPSFLSQGLVISPSLPDTHYVTQAGLKLTVILLPQSPEYWDYRHAP